jgi:hydrogenase expression/formation protein HypD
VSPDAARLPYVTDFRDAPACRALLLQIDDLASHAGGMSFMEFCGGHTHAIGRCGIRRAVPEGVRLLSGPGCPVCVTAQGDVDAAVALAEKPGVLLATFGDMMRVPGSGGSLLDARARGADVRVVYSPMDALTLAREMPSREVAFLGVGFETTAPGVAATVLQAVIDNVPNFSVLSLHKLTPPAMRAIVEAGEVKLDGIIGPGHVSTIVGADAWRFLPDEYGIGCAIAGFEPTDILSAIRELAGMVREHAPRVANCYPRSVSAAGNRTAVTLMERVFEPATVSWRGLGRIRASGLVLRPFLSEFDAAKRLDITVRESEEPRGCRCGEVLRGVVTPTDCPLFGRACTPDSPVGPCMVSAEGTCAAYYDEGTADE